ncbi:MAG: phosphomannose isomerase type II C-terminal cupin domain [Notoacmeibacter sp.]|nr:phosphomannose isomerase type II C-terminal cupin domain [Notoacmeibacter sp.]MCC0032185.1 phosphomannose isomerase type II C-terminal cupin domain [Brucellaceae bacterium]
MSVPPKPVPAQPVPVILASHPLKRFWPRSSPERPWCFRRGTGAHSPVERLIEAFCADKRFAPPLLVCSELAVRAACEQTSTWRERGVKVLAVPADTRNGTAAALAALELAALNNRRGLLFVPATMVAGDGSDLSAFLAESIASLEDPHAALVQTRAAQPGDAGPAFATGRSLSRGRFHTVGDIRILGDGESAPAEAGPLQVPVGSFYCPAPVFMDALRDAAPVLLKSAVNALQLADRVGAVVHPHSGFLSLMTGYSAADFLIAGRTRILLQPVGGRLRSLNGWADVDPSGDNGASPLPIHAAGLGPCRVIQGSGGVFIAAKGYEAQAEHHFPAPGQTETGRTPKLRTRNWGAEQLVEEDYGIKIMRLEVDPGGVLPPECHFRRRETWSVSSGQAIAKIDQRIVKLLPGDHVTLEPGMIHSLRNAANEVLVLYETRIGSYLEDDDRVRIQPPAAGRSSAAGP